ncbi:hypothetical protein FE249_18400 (plasmid) [Acidiphilium multivorum]|uniref:hypothetical protein n=1 Tax=Acidiphilium TaxID=522 RepID=UPI00157ADA26|nr:MULTISPECIES: hypothetical protein [Acidiphilium]UNC16226.1 hypothetical protein FE249_18400 [Acidiphilium multivorum]
MPKAQAPDFAPSATPAPWSISLRNQEAGSDKVYNITLRPDGDLWRVDYQNGRYGSSLVSGTKTASPVAYAEAAEIATSLLVSKLKGKYRPMAMPGAESAPVYVEPNDTGVRPHLLSAIGKDDLGVYLSDPTFMAQEKKDGHRRFIRHNPETGTTGINRRGLAVGLPRIMVDVFAEFPIAFLIDGEMVGETFWAFDLLEHGGDDLRPMGAANRYRRLESLYEVMFRNPAFREIGFNLIDTAWGERNKTELLQRVTAEGGEGVVFKEHSAPYVDGRNGDQLKFKLWNDLSAIAGDAKSGKRSVEMKLVDDATGTLMPVGYVTIPANHEIPAPGTVVNIRYLYAYPDGSLFQPQYEGERSDITAAECLASQRAFAPAAAPQAAIDSPEPGM